MTLAYACGLLSASPLGLGGSTALLLTLTVASLHASGPRPQRATPTLVMLIGMGGAAGAFAAKLGGRVEAGACDLRLAAGPVSVRGRLLGAPARGWAHLRMDAGPCRGSSVFVLWNSARSAPGVGVPMSVQGFWRGARGGRNGTLVVREFQVLEDRPSWSLLRVRGRLLEISSAHFGDRADVLDALLLARREALAPERSRAFARAGVAHLMAISGFHVGVVAALCFAAALLASMPPTMRPLWTALGVFGYIALIGFPAAATRAGLFLTTLAVGRWRGRPLHAPSMLWSVLLALLVSRPEWAFTPGLQLSFAGILGLGTLRTPVRARLVRAGVPRPLADPVAATVAASLATWPLVAWHFGEISLLGLLLSPLFTPAVAVVVMGGVLTLAVASILPSGAGVLAAPTVWGAEALLWTVERAAALPLAAVPVTREEVLLVVLLVGIGVRASRGARSAVRATVLIGFLATLPAWSVLRGTMSAAASRLRPGGGALEIVAIDVGQGDAIAIRTPGGRWMLVDTGGRGPEWDAGRQRVVPYLERRGVRELALLVLSHPDLDHAGGLTSVLESLPVGRVLDSGSISSSAELERALRRARSEGVPWNWTERGDVWELDGVRMEVLSPAPADSLAGPNDRSIVLWLRYGAFDALLTGDASAEVEARLDLERLGRLELLKVGHHGSRTSTGTALLERAPPEVALVSVGARNRYGHPDPGVVRRLEASGAHILRTDEMGTVRIRAVADGSWSARSERR